MIKITTLISTLAGAILVNMKALVKPTQAPTPYTPQSGQVSLLLAGILTIMVVAQLFTFEDFINTVDDLTLPLGLPSLLVATYITVAEVMALPFLLRMDLSPAFRWLSMALGWVAVLFWLFVSCWVWFFAPEAETAGFLGAIALPPGPWMILISAALAILSAWSSWGLWPGRNSTK